jgi:hypothetical protein
VGAGCVGCAECGEQGQLIRCQPSVGVEVLHDCTRVELEKQWKKVYRQFDEIVDGAILTSLSATWCHQSAFA